MLQHAVLAGSQTVVGFLLDFLLDRKQMPNLLIRDRDGNSLLHLAAIANVPEGENFPEAIVSVVLRKNKQELIGLVNQEQQNALVFMASRQPALPRKVFRERMRELLRAGISPSDKDRSGKTAQDYLQSLPEMLADYNELVGRVRDGSIQHPFDFRHVQKEMDARYQEWKKNLDRQHQENLARYEEWQRRNAQGGTGRSRCQHGTCKECGGLGFTKVTSYYSCVRCNGLGQVREVSTHLQQYGGWTRREAFRSCPDCNGSGKRYVEVNQMSKCPRCGGGGCESAPPR